MHRSGVDAPLPNGVALARTRDWAHWRPDPCTANLAQESAGDVPIEVAAVPCAPPFQNREGACLCNAGGLHLRLQDKLDPAWPSQPSQSAPEEHA